MVDWITGTIRALGYPGLVFLMFLENVFPPVPSELIMPFAGFIAGRGQLAFWGVVLAGTVGSVLGSLPLYFLGRHVDEERLKEWLGRHGKWLGLSPEDVERARELFRKHGASVVFFGRLIPGVRSLIALPAGTTKLHLAQFLLYTTLGAGVWTTALAACGLLLRNNYERVEQYLNPVTYAVFGIILILYVRRLFKRSHEPAPEGG